MSKALLDSIVAVFNASAALQAAFAGGIVAGDVSADDDMQRPYLQIQVISATADKGYGAGYFGDIRVQFSARVETQDDALEAAKVMTDAFDVATFSPASGTIMNVIRQTSPIPMRERSTARKVDEEDADGEDAYAANVDYIFSVDGV